MLLLTKDDVSKFISSLRTFLVSAIDVAYKCFTLPRCFFIYLWLLFKNSKAFLVKCTSHKHIAWLFLADSGKGAGGVTASESVKGW